MTARHRATPLAETRQDRTQDRRRVCNLLGDVGSASVARIGYRLDLSGLEVRSLLRTLRKQGVVARIAQDTWALTGNPPKPRAVRRTPISKANTDGIPRVVMVPAVQIGMARDPLTAALFGPRPA